MAAPQTGTYHLDGLLEGPLGGDAATTPRLADWIRIAQTSGYGFSLDTEGDSFSLLADNQPRTAPTPETDMAEPLRDLLEQLVGSFPPPLQPQLFSTVRAVQYGEGVETQTIFQVMPDGRVEAQQRTVDARTSKAEAPLTTTQKLKLVGIALLVLFALFGVTSIFVDWGDQASKALRKIGPVDTDAIQTETGPFEAWFTVAGMEARGNVLRIRLARADGVGYPTREQLQTALASPRPESPYEERLTLEALAKGWARIEAFDAEGSFQGAARVRIGGLRDEETIVVAFPIQRETPPATLRFTW